MSSWRQLKIDGLGPIARVAAVFEIGPPLELLPFAKFKVKIIERDDGSFLGVPNVAKVGLDWQPEWIGGLGASVEEALEDALRNFVQSLGNRTDLAEDSFAWAEPEDF